MVKLVIIIAHGSYIESSPKDPFGSVNDLWNQVHTSLGINRDYKYPPPTIQSVDTDDVRLGNWGGLFQDSLKVYDILNRVYRGYSGDINHSLPTIPHNQYSSDFIKDIRSAGFTLGHHNQTNVFQFCNHKDEYGRFTEPDAKWGVYLFDNGNTGNINIEGEQMLQKILKFKANKLKRAQAQAPKKLTEYVILGRDNPLNQQISGNADVYKKYIDVLPLTDYYNPIGPEDPQQNLPVFIYRTGEEGIMTSFDPNTLSCRVMLKNGREIPTHISNLRNIHLANDGYGIYEGIFLSIIDIYDYFISEHGFWPTIFAPICRQRISSFDIFKNQPQLWNLKITRIDEARARSFSPLSQSPRFFFPGDDYMKDETQGLIDSLGNLSIDDEDSVNTPKNSGKTTYSSDASSSILKPPTFKYQDSYTSSGGSSYEYFRTIYDKAIKYPKNYFNTY